MTEMNEISFTTDTCIFVLMKEAHTNDAAAAALLETMQGFTYMCQSVGCMVLKSYRGGILEKSGRCKQNNDDISPPRGDAHTTYVIGGEDNTYYD